jgi:hypothetical protein|tara:strand:+ start:632 stop:814 length:183 start_codon:yes stop_codon:yes gene_type:complete
MNKKRTKEKEAIMAVLQSYGLKQANLTSEFTREQIADDIMKEQKKIWTNALAEVGITLED